MSEGSLTTLEEQVSALLAFGLTPLQARLYLGLLKSGPCHASQISSQVGIVRPEVYRVLRELSAMGLVRMTLGFPAIYSSLPPSEGLLLLVQRLKDKTLALEKKTKELTQSLKAVELSTEPSRQLLTLIIGENNLLQKTNQMIENAREEYAGIWSELGLHDVVDGDIARKLRAAKNRGVRIRLIAEIGAHGQSVANYLTRYAEVRKSRNILFYMDIIDQKEMVFGPSFPVPGESRVLESREYNIFTNNARFVSGMYAIFDKLWRTCPKHVPRRLSKAPHS